MSASETRMKKLNILVAGGAGYIGSVVTAHLMESGHSVVVLDNLSTGYRQAIHPGARFVRGDIAEQAAVETACEGGIDVAMHFAAFIEVGESVANPAKYYENNVIKAVRFIDNLRRCGIEALVFSSTAAVYGEPDIVPITESAALHPVNPYGRSKLFIENVLADYDSAYAFRSVALRYFNAGGSYGSYGENHHPESHLIPIMLNAVKSGGELKVYGDNYDTRDGSCIRDYIHVSDLAKAHILAAQYLAAGGSSDCFNLGTGNGYSVLEVIDTVERVLGKHVSTVMAARRDGDPAALVASPDKAMAFLGWKGAVSTLEDIISSAWQWKQEFPNGYGDE